MKNLDLKVPDTLYVALHEFAATNSMPLLDAVSHMLSLASEVHREISSGNKIQVMVKKRGRWVKGRELRLS